MSGNGDSTMSEAEISDFLAGEGTGVLSFAADNESYSIPVSYGYDPSKPAFYLQLEVSAESGKPPFIEATETASFVVYNRIEGEWKSVVARGKLEPVSEAEVDREIAIGLQRADAPLAAIFSDERGTLSFQIHRLTVEELDGKKANSHE